MTSPAIAFCAGLLVASAAYADDVATCRSHRPAHVTYGGLPAMHGYERDHIVPLCLGGADDRSNVRYQPLAEAVLKDRAEHNACRYACAAGPAAISAAREDFRVGDWRKWIEE